ncbi:MAG: hypothetical protein M0P71_15115 [Melioribacteraceae bacterium]|jgi:hypothetical protein|nr:hypothetical protein [Melioribacteraceae bacterium]
MKRLSVLFILLAMFCLTGCLSTGMQIKGDSELSAVAEIAARRIGFFVAQNEKANIETITKYVDLLLTQDDDQLQAMALYGLRYLSTKYTGDPLLADDLLTVMRLLGVDLSLDEIDLDGGDLKTLRVFAEAFRKGLKV